MQSLVRYACGCSDGAPTVTACSGFGDGVVQLSDRSLGRQRSLGGHEQVVSLSVRHGIDSGRLGVGQRCRDLV